MLDFSLAIESHPERERERGRRRREDEHETRPRIVIGSIKTEG